ncbi:hypothetical protein E0Z10_g7753 [Xylaria hypoxylon]|uniref:Uncharacterized protein n=1 Tax=Xylaria hypoxylon TaxID=37992 RepID=A0A4Z0Y9X4_9PEZI|nr:hypothetical protein E0Z10_g7753 [Xylaria hypoxylon]
MAPQLPPPSTLVFDSRTQIIDNCEFIISKDDIVQVITSKNPADKFFKAYAVRCNEDSREVLLVSELCENAQKAVESLHTKSCEAIHNYVTINGFSSPRDLKTALLEPNLDDDDAVSIISGHSDSSTAAFSEWGSSGDEAMMLKHASGANGPSKDRQQRPAGRPGCCTATAADVHEPVANSRSRGAVRDAFANPAPPRARGVRPARSRSPPFAFRQAPPPPPGHPGHPRHPSANSPPAPPPSMRNMPMPLPPHPYPAGMAVGPHPARPQNNLNPSMPPTQHFTCFRVPGFPVDGPPFPINQGGNRPPKPSGPHANDSSSGNGSGNGSHPPRPLSVFHPSTRTHTVRITVHWLRHGQHRIIAQCQPTRESLQSTAVADVRMNPGAFIGDSPSSGINRDGGRLSLRAHVRQAVFAGEPHDMRTFHGQDLARLFHVMAADDSMPSFEVVVEDFPRGADDDDEDDDEASVRGSPNLMKGERWD